MNIMLHAKTTSLFDDLRKHFIPEDEENKSDDEDTNILERLFHALTSR